LNGRGSVAADLFATQAEQVVPVGYGHDESHLTGRMPDRTDIEAARGDTAQQRLDLIQRLNRRRGVVDCKRQGLDRDLAARPLPPQGCSVPRRRNAGAFRAWAKPQPRVARGVPPPSRAGPAAARGHRRNAGPDRTGWQGGDGLGSQRPSAVTRPGGGAQGGAAPGSQRPSASTRSAGEGRGTADRGPKAFEGSRSGAQARRDSSRGQASRESAAWRGGGGGGGVQRTSGSRGGGAQRSGGGRGGGGRR